MNRLDYRHQWYRGGDLVQTRVDRRDQKSEPVHSANTAARRKRANSKLMDEDSKKKEVGLS